jgi:HD-like signal output (HDOD) protein
MTTRENVASEILPDWMRSDIEQRIRTGMLELPLLPQVAAEALELCLARDSGTAEMAKILHRDHGLAGNVLRVANSPVFGVAVQITSLQQAVGRIGIHTIKEVVLSVATKATIFEAPPDWSHCVRDLPRLSLVSGLYATQVARACDHNGDAAFLSAFLHDMGWPVVMFILKKLEVRHEQAIKPSMVEVAGDIYHAEVGAQLAKSWGLAEAVVTAIRHHEDWADMDQIPAGAALVSLADQLARAAISQHPETEESVLNHPAIGPLNLNSGHVGTLLDMRDQILEMADAII